MISALKPNILIVDDEEILELFNLSLEEEGYGVETARCGVMAIEKAKKSEYYLALLDFILPDIKGTEIASHLYKKKRIKNILFVKRFSHIFNVIDPKIRDRCKVLFKPVSVEILINNVREAFEPIDMLSAQELVTID